MTRLLVAIAFVASLAAAGCGDSKPTGNTGSGGAAPASPVPPGGKAPAGVGDAGKPKSFE